MILLAQSLPFYHHTFAGDKLFGFDFGRQMLGERKVLRRSGLEQRDGPRVRGRRRKTLMDPGFPVVGIDLD